jgi:hypothetical protein
MYENNAIRHCIEVLLPKNHATTGARQYKLSRPWAMALNLLLGWIAGDDLRVLVGAGLPVGPYAIQQIRVDMNYLGDIAQDAVYAVQDLLDQYDAVQVRMNELNISSESRVLKKADVLEWEVSDIGTTYGPERELGRIRGLLSQYFSFSPLFSGMGTIGTALIRS